MSRIFEQAQSGGGVRLLILGSGHYPFAQNAKLKVPRLADIDSAARSALDFATRSLTDWRGLFQRPISSVDLLVNDATHPDGVDFACPGASQTKLDAPTLSNIAKARNRWLEGVQKDDTLIFYCCGHGIWLPSFGRTFLASNFGEDPEVVWSNAVSLDGFSEGLGDKAPRHQWLIFDCCATDPPDSLRNARPSTNPLVEVTPGLRQEVVREFGTLAQTVVSSSSIGEAAFGRPNGRSRFMDVFVEACTGSGFQSQAPDGSWLLNSQGLEAAMASYRYRAADFGDIDYYTFARLTTSDAAEFPVLMARQEPPACTLLVTTDPPYKLKQADLDIHCAGQRIDGQAAGQDALERFRRPLDAYEKYQISAYWPRTTNFPSQSVERRALPPLCEVKF